jgi:exopolysaccharide production protein ExoQ
MLPKLILLASLALSWWLIRRDVARREGISSAIWIPTIWMAIIASRPVSMWLGFGGGTSTMEGSPVDGLIFFILIIAAFTTLSRRSLNWSQVISENWPIFLFYAFLLISILWANSPLTSFKRWFKEFGNIAVLLVILTEAKPQLALRAVVVRCAYLLLPLSFVFIRYFPSLGRFYSSHGGEGEIMGVATQKNSFGVLLLVCGLVLLWDWLELRKEQRPSKAMRLETKIHFGLLLLALYLMHLSHSATSTVCLIVGAAIVGATRLPFFRKRPDLLGVAALTVVLTFWILDQTVGIKEDVVSGLGRDMTYTGRTDVWRELLALHTDPVLGVGFMSFWDDEHYQRQLPEGTAHSSAHNGYLEEYIGGGWVGISFVIVMLLGVGLRINGALKHDGDYGAVRLAIFSVFLIHNFSESDIACMTPLGFLFLLAAIGHVASNYEIEMLPESYSATKWQPSATEPERTFAPTYRS